MCLCPVLLACFLGFLPWSVLVRPPGGRRAECAFPTYVAAHELCLICTGFDVASLQGTQRHRGTQRHTETQAQTNRQTQTHTHTHTHTGRVGRKREWVDSHGPAGIQLTTQTPVARPLCLRPIGMSTRLNTWPMFVVPTLLTMNSSLRRCGSLTREAIHSRAHWQGVRHDAPKNVSCGRSSIACRAACRACTWATRACLM